VLCWVASSLGPWLELAGHLVDRPRSRGDEGFRSAVLRACSRRPRTRSRTSSSRISAALMTFADSLAMLSGSVLATVSADTYCKSIVFGSTTPTGLVIVSSDCEWATV